MEVIHLLWHALLATRLQILTSLSICLFVCLFFQGEDIAINFFVAKRNGGKGCLVVQSDHRELPTNASTGLSTRVPTEQWQAMRQKCVGLLSQHFTDGFLRQFPRTNEIVLACVQNSQ
jgi:hypothetical protein